MSENPVYRDPYARRRTEAGSWAPAAWAPSGTGHVRVTGDESMGRINKRVRIALEDTD